MASLIQVHFHPYQPLIYIDYTIAHKKRRRRVPIRGLHTNNPTAQQVLGLAERLRDRHHDLMANIELNCLVSIIESCIAVINHPSHHYYQLPIDVDLNKLGELEYTRVMAKLDNQFQDIRIKPEDPRFVYDYRVDFGDAKEELNDWDYSTNSEPHLKSQVDPTCLDLAADLPPQFPKIMDCFAAEQDNLYEQEHTLRPKSCMDNSHAALNNGNEPDTNPMELKLMVVSEAPSVETASSHVDNYSKPVMHLDSVVLCDEGNPINSTPIPGDSEHKSHKAVVTLSNDKLDTNHASANSVDSNNEELSNAEITSCFTDDSINQSLPILESEHESVGIAESTSSLSEQSHIGCKLADSVLWTGNVLDNKPKASSQIDDESSASQSRSILESEQESLDIVELASFEMDDESSTSQSSSALESEHESIGIAELASSHMDDKSQLVCKNTADSVPLTENVLDNVPYVYKDDAGGNHRLAGCNVNSEQESGMDHEKSAQAESRVNTTPVDSPPSNKHNMGNAISHAEDVPSTIQISLKSVASNIPVEHGQQEGTDDSSCTTSSGESHTGHRTQSLSIPGNSQVHDDLESNCRTEEDEILEEIEIEVDDDSDNPVD